MAAFRILSVDGGGIRGVLSAVLINRLLGAYPTLLQDQTGTIRLRATVPNKDHHFWPGQFVNVRLILSTQKGAVLIPTQTTAISQQGTYVYVIKPDNTVERRDVEVAAVQDGIAVVTKGLAPGDRVVVDGQYRLTNGARVKVDTAG